MSSTNTLPIAELLNALNTNVKNVENENVEEMRNVLNG